MEKQLHVLGEEGAHANNARDTACAYASTQSQRAAGLCIKINDTQYDDLTTVLETIKGSTRGRKRYAYCATQIHGAPPEMGITHLVEVMEPNGSS
jgi:hypothetical protein